MKLAESGMKVVEVCRKDNISDVTFYQWWEKYGDMTVFEGRLQLISGIDNGVGAKQPWFFLSSVSYASQHRNELSTRTG